MTFAMELPSRVLRMSNIDPATVSAARVFRIGWKRGRPIGGLPQALLSYNLCWSSGGVVKGEQKGHRSGWIKVGLDSSFDSDKDEATPSPGKVSN